MSKKSSTMKRPSSSAKKASGGSAHQDLSPKNAERIKGGRSLDAGGYFKYDIKKEG